MNTYFIIQPDSLAQAPQVDPANSWGWGAAWPAFGRSFFNSYTDVTFVTPANLQGNPRFDMYLWDGDYSCNGVQGDYVHVFASQGTASIVTLEA
jgi:hypothetical protein